MLQVLNKCLPNYTNQVEEARRQGGHVGPSRHTDRAGVWGPQGVVTKVERQVGVTVSNMDRNGGWMTGGRIFFFKTFKLVLNNSASILSKPYVT